MDYVSHLVAETEVSEIQAPRTVPNQPRAARSNMHASIDSFDSVPVPFVEYHPQLKWRIQSHSRMRRTKDSGGITGNPINPISSPCLSKFKTGRVAGSWSVSYLCTRVTISKKRSSEQGVSYRINWWAQYLRRSDKFAD